MTPDEPMTFDAPLAAAARDRDMARVDRAVDPEWRDLAYEAVVETAAELPDGFIVDDVWQHLPAGVEDPREPRAMGPVMRRAQSAGIIVPTNEYRPSARVTAHRNPRRVWRAA